MIAQCTQCGKTFETDTWGVQTCPHCGTQVMLERPGEVPPAGGPEPGAGQGAWTGGPVGGQQGAGGPVGGGGWGEGAPYAEGPGERTPWERRPTLGFFKGFFETWKGSLFQPTEFFGRMRTDDGAGAFSYGWLAYTVGGLASVVWAWLTFGLTSRMLLSNPQFANEPQAKAMLDMVRNVMGPAGLVLVPIAAVIGLFVYAGLVHLGLMMFGGNKRGWNATFRSVGYTQGVQLFNVIPFAVVPGLGSLIGLGLAGWQLWILVIAVKETHRITGGRAALAVLFWPVLLFCCALLFVGLGLGLALHSASQAGAL